MGALKRLHGSEESWVASPKVNGIGRAREIRSEARDAATVHDQVLIFYQQPWQPE